MEDYHALAGERGFKWLGLEVPNARTKTRWECPKGHQWEAAFAHIQEGTGCPYCTNRVNGVLASSQQIAIGEMLSGEINYYADGYYIDIALEWQGVNVAIEYDGWYWHQDTQEEDSKRDIALMLCDWHILRIKSGAMMPTYGELITALNQLVQSDTMRAELILPDWQTANAD